MDKVFYMENYSHPFMAEWTLLPQFFGQVHFLYKGCLVGFYFYHFLKNILYL